jgi:hypothetical protein
LNKENCTYCKKVFSAEDEKYFCGNCGKEYHKSCYDKLKKCAEKNCGFVFKSELEKLDIGEISYGELKEEVEQAERLETRSDCPKCGKAIQDNSRYCRYCGADLKETEKKTEDSRIKFESEFKNRYDDNVKIKRRWKYAAYLSIIILIAVISVTFYYAYRHIDERVTSEEYKIKYLVYDWNDAYKNRDMEKLKKLFDKDFKYYDKAGKEFNAEKRIKQIGAFVKSEQYKSVLVDDIAIKEDSTAKNYAFVKFSQIFYFGKNTKTEKLHFKIYKGEDTEKRWKIFREYGE